ISSFYSSSRPPPRSTFFPSTTLFRSVLVVNPGDEPFVRNEQQRHPRRLVDAAALRLDDAILDLIGHAEPVPAADAVRFEQQRDVDRKSTRLNSSHRTISYAVFCLKKN